MTLGKWTLLECDYCQGAIGDTPAWSGGHPFHRECLEHRNAVATRFIDEMQRQIKEDAERYPA